MQFAIIGPATIACGVVNGTGYFAKVEQAASATLAPRQVDAIDYLPEHNPPAIFQVIEIG